MITFIFQSRTTYNMLYVCIYGGIVNYGLDDNFWKAKFLEGNKLCDNCGGLRDERERVQLSRKKKTIKGQRKS